MEINEKEIGPITVLYIDGNLVGKDLEILSNKFEDLLKQKRDKLVINLEKVDIMDSLSVDVIDNAIQNGLKIRLVHFPSRLLNYIHHFKVNKEITIYNQEKDAVQSLIEEIKSSSKLENDRRQDPRVSISLSAAIIIKDDLNDIIFPNALTRNISTSGAWIEYADVSEVYDFKTLFSLGIRDGRILELYLETSKRKAINVDDKKDNLQIECNILRVNQGNDFLGIGLKFREELKLTRFLSIL
ncbi:STAS domain-containing protein [Candidatus Desantisbacteria bacterium]|nr:STAS domain-containing protein [Candidatus Desantisbacteria bacterium]